MTARKIFIPVLVIAALGIIVASQYPKLYIATGYGAKSMATAVFVTGRDPLMVKSLDLNYSIVKYTQSVVDFENKRVTTSFWGLAKQTAVYRRGFGCCLVGEHGADSLQKTVFNPPVISLSGSWRIPWPDGDHLKDTVFPEIDTLRLKSAVDWAFGIPSADKRWTAAVAVIYKGELVAEKYSGEMGITADTRIWGWSMNKSVINAMVGVLSRQGKLNVNASPCSKLVRRQTA